MRFVALEAADGKNVEVFSPTIGSQLLRKGLIDEIDLHIAPILLGDGIRLFDDSTGPPVRLHGLGSGAPTAAINLRYRPLETS
jgi:dihydrofolate reductase